MRVVTLPAQIYILVFILGSMVCYKYSLKRKQYNFLVALFIVSIVIEAHNVNIPARGGDLVIHFQLLDDIKKSDMPFLKFIFNNGGLGSNRYSQLYAFNVLRYVIAKLTDDYFVLPAICVLVEYSVFMYIMTDWNADNGYHHRIDTLSLLVCFACAPMIAAVSGVRNIMAFSITGLGIYLYLYKGKSLLFYIMLTFIGATIHPSVLLTVPFVFLARLNLKLIGVLAVFLISLVSSLVARYLSQSSIPYFQIIGRAFFTYTSEDQYRTSRFMLYGDVLFLITFLATYLLQRNYIHTLDERKKKLYDFCGLYMVYILGNIGNFDMILRPTYLVGIFGSIVTTLLRDKGSNSTYVIGARFSNLLTQTTYLSAFLLSIYVNAKYLMAYGDWFIGR